MMLRRSLVCIAVAFAVFACGSSGSANGPDGSVGDASGGGGGCTTSYAGCTKLSDHTGDTSPPFVAIVTSSNAPEQYSSPCILIHPGQGIVLPSGAGDPLLGASCSSPNSPLPMTTPAAGSTLYTFTTAGNYGYYSTTHGSDNGTGLAGLVVVE